MGDLLQLIISIVAILLGLIFGRRAEQRHFADLQRRELLVRNIPARSESSYDPIYTKSMLVMGNVVIANDRFKDTVAKIKTFFGGRLTSLESLMDRGRREAVLRLREEAMAWGAKEVIHLRIDSSTLDQKGVEIFASGTAIK